MDARIESIERLGVASGRWCCDSIERIEAVRVAFGSLLLTVRKWAAKASKVASCYRLHVRAHV